MSVIPARRMQKQRVFSSALVIQQELNKNKRTQVLTMHVLNENIRNNHKAYVFEKTASSKRQQPRTLAIKGVKQEENSKLV